MGLATVFSPSQPEDLDQPIGAGLNAFGPIVCDDPRMRPTVLIVDDHDDFRRSASALLEQEGFSVVGGAADGDAALVEVERLRPEVVLLDVRLPGKDGFEVAELLTARPDPPMVVLISSREAVAHRSRLDSSPARGFISKRELSGEALSALVA